MSANARARGKGQGGGHPPPLLVVVVVGGVGGRDVTYSSRAATDQDDPKRSSFVEVESGAQGIREDGHQAVLTHHSYNQGFGLSHSCLQLVHLHGGAQAKPDQDQHEGQQDGEGLHRVRISPSRLRLPLWYPAGPLRVDQASALGASKRQNWLAFSLLRILSSEQQVSLEMSGIPHKMRSDFTREGESEEDAWREHGVRALPVPLRIAGAGWGSREAATVKGIDIAQ